ncbi:MAG: Rieske 2Fe-2S domain-containing protein, partial [Chloroflexota bacterium]
MVIATKGIDWDELVQPTRVHGRLYYDPDIFEAELQKIWYRDWIFVGHESEVNDAGDYATRQIGLEPVIMTRDERGKIHLLLNRCVHRGATVCQLESGNASAFRCAYHGWTYRNTGELIGVPFDRAYPVSFRIDHPSLITVPRVASYRGFVFGSMSPDGLDLVEFLGGAREAIIDRLCDLSPEGEIEIRSAWVKDRTQCNWKTALDNPWGAGADHSQFTHRSVPRRSRTMPSRGVASESVPAFVEKGVREPSAESEFTDFTEWKGHDLDHGHIWTV